MYISISIRWKSSPMLLNFTEKLDSRQGRRYLGEQQISVHLSALSLDGISAVDFSNILEHFLKMVAQPRIVIIR